METGDALERLVRLMAQLRAPDGCPWDREQTLESLRPFIVEEAYELVDAIDRSDTRAIQEELGDMVLEVLFVTQISAEQRRFTMREVLESLEQKIIRRHAHVFGPRKARDSGEALARWEQIKEVEKPEQPSLLGEVPRALPALMRAGKLSAQAARAGFDWSSAKEVIKKVREELVELENALAASDRSGLAQEVGDLLFATVNLARHLDVDPEMALHSTNQKFIERFRHIETRLEAQNRSVRDSSLEEMEALWEEAKKKTP